MVWQAVSSVAADTHGQTGTLAIQPLGLVLAEL